MTDKRWQKIEQLYHAALEREESQRAAYLHEVCAGDEALRREVESLLAQEKRRVAVPGEEALGIAHQIAEALEAAHEMSIIHRDLEPANLKVMPEGKVKVLDFGLAKAFAEDTARGNPSESPTLSEPLQSGLLLSSNLGGASYELA